MTGFALDSIGSYANDPYFMYALNNSYYPNFMAAPQVTQQTPQVIPEAANVIPQAKTEENSSNAGLVVGGLLTVGAGALLYKAHKKGGDKGIAEGFKQIWRGLTGKAPLAVSAGGAQNIAEITAERATSKFSAVMGADGKLVYTIPDKTKKISGQKAVEDFANKYGIELDKLARIGKNTKLDSYKFVFEDGGIKNTVTVKNGEIIDIHNGTASIKDFLTSSDTDKVKFVEKLKERVATIERRESGWGKGLTDIQYTNQIADNTLSITKANLKANTPASKVELTALDRFAEDSDQVQAFFYRNPELKNLFTSKEIAKGKLPNGMKIESYVHNFDANTKCHYRDGELIGITQNSKYYAKGTDKCDAFVSRNSKVLETIVKRLFKDNNIPTDIKAVLVAA